MKSRGTSDRRRSYSESSNQKGVVMRDELVKANNTLRRDSNNTLLRRQKRHSHDNKLFYNPKNFVPATRVP